MLAKGAPVVSLYSFYTIFPVKFSYVCNYSIFEVVFVHSHGGEICVSHFCQLTGPILIYCDISQGNSNESACNVWLTYIIYKKSSTYPLWDHIAYVLWYLFYRPIITMCNLAFIVIKFLPQTDNYHYCRQRSWPWRYLPLDWKMGK